MHAIVAANWSSMRLICVAEVVSNSGGVDLGTLACQREPPHHFLESYPASNRFGPHAQRHLQ